MSDGWDGLGDAWLRAIGSPSSAASMRRERYERPESDEWVQPVPEGYKMACCDCGLVHQMDFRVADGRVQFRVRRDNRATAMKRRHKGYRKDADGIWRAR